MRVLYSADALRPPRTGIGQYAAHLLAALPEVDPALEMIPFAGHFFPVTPAMMAAWLAPEAGAAVGQGSGRPPLSRRVRSALAKVTPLRLAYASLLQVRGRRMARRLGRAGGIYHELNNVLLPFDGPTVVTIHDLSCLHYPQFHPRERVAYFERHFAPSAARAGHIITDSAFIKRDIIATLGIPAERITAIPLGMTGDFSPRPAAEVTMVLARYGLSADAYVLAVGSREPRKNLRRLIDAHNALPDTLGRRFPLVLAGPPGWRADDIEAAVDDLEARGRGRRLGYVPAADLPALYTGAAVFAYPSLYEGFGLPALEAAACGTAVLTSSGSPMAEFLGTDGGEDGALLVDPQDTDALRQALDRLLSDPADRRALALRGRTAAARHTWRATAAATADVYRRVLAG